jgi:hypothetical protein
MTFALLFEAKSIQSFLFGSGRMRDAIAASELVESLTGGLLDAALNALDLPASMEADDDAGAKVWFSRRAGGAFHAFLSDADDRDRLLALWTLMVQQRAPGLAFAVGTGDGATMLEAFRGAREAMQADAARLRPDMPLASPLATRSRRTGLAAVRINNDDEPVDATVNALRPFRDASRQGLVERVSPPEGEIGWRHWPLNMEAGEERSFPFLGRERTVALVHADGNGLGQLLARAADRVAAEPDRFLEVFRSISTGIARATETAVQTAVRETLVPARQEGMLPARPILVGGDDLTMIVRADLAVPFTRAFVRAFEQESAPVMAQLAELGLNALPDKLTIGAGLVYLRASQPFYLASSLVSDLTDRAKRDIKRIDPDQPPSGLSLLRVTSALGGDASELIERELTTESDANGASIRYRSTLGTYLLDDRGNHGPRLADLESLVDLLGRDDMARGPARQLLGLVARSPIDARRRYDRWRQVMRAENDNAHDDFMKTMHRLMPGFDPDTELPFIEAADGMQVSPLGDAETLLAAGRVMGWEARQ